MKHCDKCKVDVESNLQNCPLCGAYLGNEEGVKSQNKHAYREVNDFTKSKNIFMKILIFASVIASVVCMIVDMTMHNELTWSLHLLVAIVGTWICLLAPIFRHTPIKNQIAIDMCVAILVVFYAEYFAHSTNNWGFHLGLPIVLISVMGIYGVLMLLNHKRWRDYAMTVTPIAILSIIPIFISLGVFHTIRWAWYVTCGISVIMLVSFFVFGRSGYVSELKKRLHF